MRAFKAIQTAGLLAGLAMAWAASARAQIELPAWCSDNMVIQQATPATQPSEIVLWGWAGAKENVRVRWPGVKEEILAKPGETGANGRRRWQVRKEDLDRAGARLEPGAPFDLAFSRWQIRTFGRDKLLDTLTRTNVWVGDVWIMGQLDGQYLPARLGGYRAVFAEAARGVRQAGLVWTGPLSQPRDWKPCDVDYLAAKWPVLCYLLTNAPSGAVPSAWVLTTDWYQNRLQLEAVKDPARVDADPVARAMQTAALAAWLQLSNQSRINGVEFQEVMVQLKRVGQITASAPPACPAAPERIHLGTPANVEFRVRGAIW